MSDISTLKRGTTIGFVGGLTQETFDTCETYGIECVEVSFSLHEMAEVYRFPENAALYAKMAANANVELWSMHLPYTEVLDISTPIDEDHARAIAMNATFIKAAAEAGMKTVVLHPVGSEPISEEIRASRVERSRSSILTLSEVCRKHSLTLAVENLPRTCLGNTSSEMAELLSGTGATVCFDTNHSLIEENKDFLHGLLDHKLVVSTLHISDYDFVDEKHRLPGDGVVDWRGVMEILEKADYHGPLMYEVSRQPRGRGRITLEEFRENQRRLSLKLL